MSAATQRTISHTSPPLQPSVAGELIAQALDTSQVARVLNVDPALGLSLSEVVERRTRYGSNSIQSIRPRPAWRVLFDQFTSVVIAGTG
jgi:magnesium-transporting ATPase (P-type)